jgi:hypothetical protein
MKAIAFTLLLLAALGYRSRVPSWKEMAVFPAKVARAAGSGASVPVECCQICGHAPLSKVLSLGYMPPVNQMVAVGELPRQQPWFPTDLLFCPQMRVGAARPGGRSSHHLPPRISLHERHHETVAR